MKSRTSFLGSARASRAGDAALGIANFSTDGEGLTQDSIDCGETPQSAREARALPRSCQLFRLGIAFYVAAFAACETSNYAPPVTTEMTRTASANKWVGQTQLERGRTLFVHRCIECHTLPPIWKYSQEDWPGIVSDMSHRASLKPEDRDAVIAYILAVRKSER